MRSSFGVGPIAAGLLCAGPALAIDCSKATTSVERIICANPDAKASDDAMAAAYSALAAELDATGRQDLLAAQRAWIAYRNDACGMSDAACVVAMTDARTAQLTATPERTGPGAPLFIPRQVWQAGTPKTYQVDIAYPQAHPASTPALAALDRALEAAAAADSDVYLAPLGPDDFTPPGQMEYQLTYRIAYADAAFVSVGYDVYAYGGGAHPNSWTVAVNFRLDEGRPLTFADMFDATGAAALRKICRRQITETKTENGVPADLIASDVTDEALDAVLQDPTKWVFEAPGLLINFDSYAIGSYAEGPYACTIDSAVLSKIVRPGAPGPV